MLLVDKVKRALKEVRERVNEKLGEDHPYVTVSLKRVKNDLEVERRDGIDFLIRKLKEDYRVDKDGNWLIIEEKPEE